jgi:hypothetical protein
MTLSASFQLSLKLVHLFPSLLLIQLHYLQLLLLSLELLGICPLLLDYAGFELVVLKVNVAELLPYILPLLEELELHGMRFLSNQIQFLVVLNELRFVMSTSLFVVLHFLVNVDSCFEHRKTFGFIQRNWQIFELLLSLLVQ